MRRNIIIKGGCDGLGKAISKILSIHDNVIVISRTEEKANKMLEELPSIVTYICDVTKICDIESTISTIIKIT